MCFSHHRQKSAPSAPSRCTPPRGWRREATSSTSSASSAASARWAWRKSKKIATYAAATNIVNVFSFTETTTDWVCVIYAFVYVGVRGVVVRVWSWWEWRLSTACMLSRRDCSCICCFVCVDVAMTFLQAEQLQPGSGQALLQETFPGVRDVTEHTSCHVGFVSSLRTGLPHYATVTTMQLNTWIFRDRKRTFSCPAQVIKLDRCTVFWLDKFSGILIASIVFSHRYVHICTCTYYVSWNWQDCI